MNVNFIVITGNPSNGVRAIIDSLKEIKPAVKDKVVLIAGKMHAAGILENIITIEDIKNYIEEGADIILFPAPRTVPSMDLAEAKELISYANTLNVLAMNAIGTIARGC